MRGNRRTPFDDLTAVNKACYRYKVFDLSLSKAVSKHWSLTSARNTVARFESRDRRKKRSASYYIWDETRKEKVA